MATVIGEAGGEVKKREYWGLRGLAYRIKKNRKAHYTLLNIEAPSAAVLEMERQMRINEDILHFMTVKVDKLEDGPTVMMRKSERGDRPRGEGAHGRHRRHPRTGRGLGVGLVLLGRVVGLVPGRLSRRA